MLVGVGETGIASPWGWGYAWIPSAISKSYSLLFPWGSIFLLPDQFVFFFLLLKVRTQGIAYTQSFAEVLCFHWGRRGLTPSRAFPTPQALHASFQEVCRGCYPGEVRFAPLWGEKWKKQLFPWVVQHSCPHSLRASFTRNKTHETMQ